MSLRQSVLSTEWYRALVSEDSVDITGDTVEFAFKTDGDSPIESDWETGEWEDGGPPYYARVLIGPEENVSLGEGRYVAWVRVTDQPEIPVRQVDALIIYGGSASVSVETVGAGASI